MDHLPLPVSWISMVCGTPCRGHHSIRDPRSSSLSHVACLLGDRHGMLIARPPAALILLKGSLTPSLSLLHRAPSENQLYCNRIAWWQSPLPSILSMPGHRRRRWPGIDTMLGHTCDNLSSSLSVWTLHCIVAAPMSYTLSNHSANVEPALPGACWSLGDRLNHYMHGLKIETLSAPGPV